MSLKKRSIPAKTKGSGLNIMKVYDVFRLAGLKCQIDKLWIGILMDQPIHGQYLAGTTL
jgi:hypothetical protein